MSRWRSSSGTRAKTATLYMKGTGLPQVAGLSSSVIASLRDQLQKARNRDGGWGYYPGKSSRIEPTCWGLLALQEPQDVSGRAGGAAGFLLAQRRVGGLLIDGGIDLPPNLA